MSPSDEILRVRAQRLLTYMAFRDLAELVRRQMAAEVSVCVRSRTAGIRLVMKLVKVAAEQVQVGPSLTGQQQQILGLCSDDMPLTPKKICRRLGMAQVSSYVRQQIRTLCKLGKLKRWGGGYIRTSGKPTLPSPQDWII